MKRAKGKAGAGGGFDSSGSSAFGSKPGSGFGGFGGVGGTTSLSYLAEPPSFSGISDPHVVVSLKNVLKKDATTKAKGLEELVSYAQAHPFEQDGGVEESILVVWTQMYPRLSIDNARRVRELSHNLQLELLKSARKRMERHIPSIVGPWLAGIYDRDRGVARAANESLASFLNTPEKVAAFWKKCHSQILDFAVEAIQETGDTLSDERSTTKDDAQAKYARVLIVSLSLVLSLLQKVEGAEIEKMTDRYEEYFSEQAVWEAVVSKDATVRKTTYQLIFVCLDRKLSYVDSPKMRLALVSGGLRADQTSSALELVRALTKLTSVHPEVWQPGAKQKSPPSKLLQNFIAKGSQGSQPKFWECLDQLLSILPSDIVSPEFSSSLMASLKTGITNREEPRTNTSLAWKCFIDTAKRLIQGLAPGDQLSFAGTHLSPLFEEFLFAFSDRPSIPVGPNAMAVFVEAYLTLVQCSPELTAATEAEWNKLAERSISLANTSGSLPPVSKDFESSQDRMAEEGRRWFGLVGLIHDKIVGSQIPNQTITPSSNIITRCIELLRTRNLIPYGAARVLEYALSTSGFLFDGQLGAQLCDFLQETAKNEMEPAITSPSSRYLLSSLRLLSERPLQKDAFEVTWTLWVSSTLALTASPTRDAALAAMISQQSAKDLARTNQSLQDEMLARTLASVRGEADAWELVEAALTYSCLTETSLQSLVRDLLGILEKEPRSKEGALRALEMVAKVSPELLSKDEGIYTALVAQSLSLSEISDTGISSKAASIRTLLESNNDGKLPVVGIIQSNLERAGAQSLEIETLVQQAKEANKTGAQLEDIVPNADVWMRELTPLLERPVEATVSITNNLGGASSLVTPANSDSTTISRDRKGRSIPARMALFSAKLQQDVDLSSLSSASQTSLLFMQCLTIQMLSDQLSTYAIDDLWAFLTIIEASLEAEDLVSSLRKNIVEKVSQATWTAGDSSVMSSLVSLLQQESSNFTPRGLYSARALGEVFETIAETRGLPAHYEDTLLNVNTLKAGPATVLPAAAILAGFGQTLQSSKAVNNFCNRLVSDVAGAKADGERTPMILALLPLCAQIYDLGELPVANNRIVFAVRQICSWMEEPENVSPMMAAAICRCLGQLLPCMKDVYGSYWETTIGFCISRWTSIEPGQLTENLPFLHASLTLMRRLEACGDANDDLQDALRDVSSSKPSALVELLKLPREPNCQAVNIVDAMLSRDVEKIDAKHVPDVSDIFGLVASDSREIQTAAFGLLHRAIPAQQEQKSVDVLLDKTDARLPDELLSLLLDAPTLESYTDDMLAMFPTAVRSYLLSWKLVFDAYSGSSFKIRNDFTENLKTDECVSPLLEFMFDVLGHSAAHALNLDKEKFTPQHIANYDVKIADSEAAGERNMQWLLIHLFYLTLKYIPGLFRAWYVNCRSKQTRIAVEAWTTKYFSPLIVADTLDEVQTWADSQEPPPADEQELVVKVSRPAREVTAGYEIDESLASIAIRVPASYPIEGVTVTGLHRVAVTERKWQSWILTTQGVITFSNGSIVDGLQAFRRNIVGAMKGQSECAICYSIISTDKRVPDKRCTTCKNLFHRSCLYKWFQSSDQNTCPLCRNPIDYLGADTAKRRI